MCSSKLIGVFWVCSSIVLSLFLVLECDRDLEDLESLGLEGGLKEDVYLVKLLSLEYERDLYLGRESRL